MDRSRRNFLVGGLSAALGCVSARALSLGSAFSFDSSSEFSPGGEFHLHPRYRTPRPLDATLRMTKPGLDEFISEKYADRVATVLGEWSANLLRSPHQLETVGRSLAAEFVGTSVRPIESRVVRPGPAIEIRHNQFARETALPKEAFLRELGAALSAYTKTLTAEFQVIRIEGGTDTAKPPERIRTEIRYDLVGSGPDFHREQRTGTWEMEWDVSSDNRYLLKTWKWLEETQSRSAGPVFVDISAHALSSNSSYSSQLVHGVDYWRAVLDGACGIDIYGHNGVSFGDIDDDGFDDFYVCQPAGLPNRLYRNRGDGTFEDITERAGVGVLDNTACALFADIDNDGRQDLIVVCAFGPLLFLNQGNGKFRRKPDAFQFASPPQGTFTGAAIADYDRDGWLDIYFCLYAYYQGTDQYRYPLPYHDAENGPPNFLLRNQRDGTFRDVTAQSGLDRHNTRYSFCCGWNDFNGDGWPDLYVVNDFGRKNLYRNNGDATFTDVAQEAGVEDVGAGMSVCWFDYDNDGADDLYVANMWTAAGLRVSTQPIFQKDRPPQVRALYRKHAMGNSLLRNKGANVFEDKTSVSGVGMGRWSWSSDAWDFDHDGYPDLYVTNGMVSGASREDLNSFFWRQVVAQSPADAKPAHDYEQGWNAINELIRADGTWSGFERNVFYTNNRDGTFSDVSGVAGLDFLEDGRAFALADIDHDGCLEVLLKNRNGPQVRVLKNVMAGLGPSISFRLQGSKSNRDAVGAVITLETEAGRQTRSLQAGSGFLSQHSKDLSFGLGEAKGAVRASIRWPSGLVQELRDLPVNHRIWVEEGSEPSRVEPFRPRSVPSGRSTLPESQPTERLAAAVGTWLLAPFAAPDFSLPDLNGKAQTLAGFRGKRVLLNFWSIKSAGAEQQLSALERHHMRWSGRGLQLLTINVDDADDERRIHALARERQYSFPILARSDDVAAVYNIVYRYLFDRHRDLGLPTSFLIDEGGAIVKVYQGPVNPELVTQDFQNIPRTPAERLAKALPFSGVSDNLEFRRNYLSYGSIFFQHGYFEEAEASFNQTLRDDPSSAEALYGLGSVYLKQQKPGEARATFQRAVKLRSSYADTVPNAWNNLGLLAAGESNMAEAIQDFREALRLSPDHLVALVNLGNAYRGQKQWEEARQVLERAVAVSPGDAEANYALGMVFAQRDDTARAYEHLQRALKARPNYPEALNNLGVLYLRTQRRNEAVASFEECIRVAPGFDQSYLNLARVYALENLPDKARAVLLELLQQRPGHAQAQKMLEQLGHARSQ